MVQPPFFMLGDGGGTMKGRKDKDGRREGGRGESKDEWKEGKRKVKKERRVKTSKEGRWEFKKERKKGRRKGKQEIMEGKKEEGEKVD